MRYLWTWRSGTQRVGCLLGREKKVSKTLHVLLVTQHSDAKIAVYDFHHRFSPLLHLLTPQTHHPPLRRRCFPSPALEQLSPFHLLRLESWAGYLPITSSTAILAPSAHLCTTSLPILRVNSSQPRINSLPSSCLPVLLRDISNIIFLRLKHLPAPPRT